MLKNNLETIKKQEMSFGQMPILLSFKSLFNLIAKDLHQQVLQGNLVNALTPMQSFIIVYIQDLENEGTAIYQKDLETMFNIRGSTATGILQLMEKKGLLTRKITKKDARLKEIKLTPKAKRLLKQAGTNLMMTEKKLAQALTEKQQQTFVNLMSKMEMQFK